MSDADQVLSAARVVLVVDWPSRDVPDTLARGGFTVIVHGGPAPDDYRAYEVEGDAVIARRVGHPPDGADLVYSYRPLDELPGIVATAQALGAGAVWTQSGHSGPGTKDPTGCWMPEDEMSRARGIVEAAGLTYIHEPYIADVVRRRLPSGGG